MSPEVRVIVLLLHLVAMLFMAAPLYALITVNERARFTIPANYNTDRYLEDVIKRQPIRCYTYLAVITVTGILLTWDKGWIWTDWALIAKLVASTAIGFLLSYVHFNIQPHIDSILDKYKPGEDVSAEDKPILSAWRGRRKRLAGVCLFMVLTATIMGVRVSWGYAPWLVAVFMVLAVVFSWRVYRNPVRLGWF